MSPFEADLGYKPRAVRNIVNDLNDTDSAEQIPFVRLQLAKLRICQEDMVALQLAFKLQFDKNRIEADIMVGDYVLLDTTHLSLKHVGTSGKRKWAI